MGGLGLPELIIVLVLVLLLFGATRLPRLARSLGEASKELKKGMHDDDQHSAPPGDTMGGDERLR